MPNKNKVKNSVQFGFCFAFACGLGRLLKMVKCLCSSILEGMKEAQGNKSQDFLFYHREFVKEEEEVKKKKKRERYFAAAILFKDYRTRE